MQLALYSFALAEAEKEWPSSSYYIISTGNVLTPEAGFFPNAEVVESAESAESVWSKCLVTRSWRLEQLRRGNIEVNAGAEPDAESEPPADGLKTCVEPNCFNNFVWLTGMAPSQ